MAPKTAPQLLTIPEAAARLRCHRDTVYELIARGELDVTDISTRGRGTSRIPEPSVAAFIERRTRNARRRLRAAG